MTRTSLQSIGRQFGVGAFLALMMAQAACSPESAPTPIETAEAQMPSFIGEVATPRMLPGDVVPIHPYLAPNGRNSMHADGYASDTYAGPGPLGRDIEVITRDGSRWPGGMCPVHTFDSAGRMIVLCANLFYFELQLLDPDTLELLASYRLPPRDSTFHALITLDPDKVMSDTSGAYFYLDDQDRVVIADARRKVQRIALEKDEDGAWQFHREDQWDLGSVVPGNCVGFMNWFPSGECDAVTAVMPDFRGLIWWVSRNGRLGTLNPKNGDIRAARLPGEEIQNGFSVASDGIYIVSDHALYRFVADAEGRPRMAWRESYDRGSGRKSGAINQGSGTTPTLIGDRYITITDNADSRVNLLVYRRNGPPGADRLLCTVPLFDEGASATDNSMIAWDRSILIENNHGYSNVFMQKDWDAVAGGITRIDIREDESGCDRVWHSEERAPSVVNKLSAATGLAYYYTFEPQPDGENAWYLMALDFRTGETVYKALAGVGSAFDNNWSPLSLGPDGTAYVGVLKGLVAFRDRQSSEAPAE